MIGNDEWPEKWVRLIVVGVSCSCRSPSMVDGRSYHGWWETALHSGMMEGVIIPGRWWVGSGSGSKWAGWSPDLVEVGWRWPGLLLLLNRVTAHWDVGAAAAAKVGDDDDG